MKKLFYLLLIPALGNAQSFDSSLNYGRGIKFIEGETWNEIVSRAKKEQKNIFLDCYTTWCVPCRKMDKEIYADAKVGEIFNKNFICYKLQIDSTKNDNDFVRALYADANFIKSSFKVYSYPTMLFFSPDGKILKRQTGLMEVDEFIKMGQDVLDPKKNYYHVLDDYNKGMRDLDEMRLIARTAYILFNDTVTANKVSREYMSLLPKKEYLTSDNIEFMQIFTRSSKDPGFKIFYYNTDSINKIMHDKIYAQSLIKALIFKEMVLPDVQKARASNTEPNWIKLQLLIKQKYNDYYADFVITSIKLDWYKLKKKWTEYTKVVVKYVDNYIIPADKKGHWPAYTLNNFAWELFKYSTDKKELNSALSWSAKAVLMDVQASWIDTYANLLYKLGENELAIKWEEIANKLDPGTKDFSDALQKMKQGKPTWLIE